MLRFLTVFAITLICLAFASGSSVRAEDPVALPDRDYVQWVADLRAEAVSKGISGALFDQAMADFKPITRVIELDRKQPEGKWTFAQYKEKVVSAARIAQGRRMYKQHRALLEQVSQKYGVAPQYIVALWGIETSYGNITGGFKVIPALATLAWEGRRAKFFRKELLEALKIVNDGHISLGNMKGSWAGAMGQNQFMPSSFHSYAVDGNNDGRKDIWGSLPDVFSSTANYLATNRWTPGQRWGREVTVPQGFPDQYVGLETKKTLQEWAALGVRKTDGGAIPVVAGFEASLVAPDGLGGPTYLVYSNYRTFLTWNRSTYFATSVGLLADAISQ